MKILLCLVILLFSHVKGQDKVIKWESNKLLTTKDFIFVDELPNNVAATSHTGIFVELVDGDYQAFAIFDPTKSYISKKVTNFAYIIEHEQGHFNITEHVVRLINNKLVGRHLIYNELNKLMSDYEISWTLLQNTYDRNTNNSQDTIQQRIWNQRISKLLKKP